MLTAALVLALLSFLLTPPSAAAFASVDVSTLCMLFALMAVVAGLRSCGLFDWLAAGVKARVRTCRGLGFLLMSLCFFFSMVITNDVALLTFVPFTLLLLADAGAFCAHVDGGAGNHCRQPGQHDDPHWQPPESVPVHEPGSGPGGLCADAAALRPGELYSAGPGHAAAPGPAPGKRPRKAPLPWPGTVWCFTWCCWRYAC